MDTEVAKECTTKNVLILEKLALPRKLWSRGKKMYYRLTWRWLSDSGGVLGSDQSYWTLHEGLAMIKDGLFASITLC